MGGAASVVVVSPKSGETWASPHASYYSDPKNVSSAF